MKELLNGAWDLHFHTAPDVVPRKYTDLELAEEWSGAGMKGGVIKCHYADTTGRAAMLRSLFPGLKVYGGLVLNRQAGGLNPDAAERMAQAGGKYLWFPTMDSLSYRKFHQGGGTDTELSSCIQVCEDGGRLLHGAYDVLDVAARYGLIVGTGHVGEKEGVMLVREAVRRGVKKVVLTHAENPATRFSAEARKECIKLGAFVEHSCFTAYHNRISWEEMSAQIRENGPEHSLLVTDFGQLNSPGSARGLTEFAEGLIKHGIKETEIEMMIKENPAALMEAD